ncbi:Protein of unknown function [Oceanobacillus limi]|uniref:DUF1232 domain-containing protein n=1 Tax=Oceanobacillus limi TaxID=930131 RepID=A0A1I0AUB9_9BACI|nr:DUF1232 domain-containing protein [Oceanobacillus limi]SES97154.1 Protein of unknown function [Oceanobacillus limi]
MFFKRLGFLFKFRKSIPFLKDFFLARDVNLLKKMLFILLIIGYIIIPFDVIPDFILGLGIVDDLTIALFLLQLMVKMAPQWLKDKYDF